MCYEDVKEGARRAYRLFVVPAGLSITLPQANNRVGLRLMTQPADAAGSFCNGVPLIPSNSLGASSPNVRGLMGTNLTWLADELTLEKHGQIVWAGWQFTATTGDALVLEIYVPDLNEPPPALP